MRNTKFVLGGLSVLVGLAAVWPEQAIGQSQSPQVCTVVEDGPPGGCPEGDCVLACAIEHELNSDLVTVHLWLDPNTTTPCDVTLMSEQGGSSYSSSVPFTSTELSTPSLWHTFTDHVTGGPTNNGTMSYKVELVDCN